MARRPVGTLREHGRRGLGVMPRPLAANRHHALRHCKPPFVMIRTSFAGWSFRSSFTCPVVFSGFRAHIHMPNDLAPDNFRKLLRRARVGVERRDMPGDLLRGLADAFADVPAVLVLLSGLPRLPDLTVRPDYCPGAGEADLDRVLDAEHLRHADFPASPVQFFFFDEPTSGRMQESSSHCLRTPFWLALTWRT